MILRQNEILNFWFGHPDEVSYGKPRKQWFVKNSQFDQQVKNLFLDDYKQAATGQLNDWQSSPIGCLALVIVLDQFPRNMFRGTPQAFATDSQALGVAQHSVTQGFDRQLLPVQRWFFYLPFEHSENMQHQCQAVELFSQLAHDPDSVDTIDYAIQHLKVIERFGRFPHRNKILGRVSTVEEEEFLKLPGSSF